MSLTLIGSAIGMLIAAAISRVLAGFLFGIPPIDPLTFTGTAVLFAAIGLAASYVPARRGSRIAKAAKEFDPNQLTLDLVPEERREREADRRHWQGRLTRLERDLREEPRRLRNSYQVRAHRLEPVGLVYLWPVSG